MEHKQALRLPTHLTASSNPAGGFCSCPRMATCSVLWRCLRRTQVMLGTQPVSQQRSRVYKQSSAQCIVPCCSHAGTLAVPSAVQRRTHWRLYRWLSCRPLQLNNAQAGTAAAEDRPAVHAACFPRTACLQGTQRAALCARKFRQQHSTQRQRRPRQQVVLAQWRHLTATQGAAHDCIPKRATH